MAHIFYKYLHAALEAALQRPPTLEEWDRAYTAVPYHSGITGEVIERDKDGNLKQGEPA